MQFFQYTAVLTLQFGMTKVVQSRQFPQDKLARILFPDNILFLSYHSTNNKRIALLPVRHSPRKNTALILNCTKLVSCLKS